MLTSFLLLSICLMGEADCVNIVEGPPSANVACGGDLQWRKFHPLVFGRPCRGYWIYNNTEVMTAGTFDDDYNCNFVAHEIGSPVPRVESRGIPTEMGKYGKFDVLIQTKPCNLAWEKSNHDIPFNAVQGRDLVFYGKQFVGRQITHADTYRYGNIQIFKPSEHLFSYKYLTPGESSDFDILVCND